MGFFTLILKNTMNFWRSMTSKLKQTLQQRLLAQSEELYWFVSTDKTQDLLKEAANCINELEKTIGEMDDIIMRLERRLDEREQFRENFSKHD